MNGLRELIAESERMGSPACSVSVIALKAVADLIDAAETVEGYVTSGLAVPSVVMRGLIAALAKFKEPK